MEQGEQWKLVIIVSLLTLPIMQRKCKDKGFLVLTVHDMPLVRYIHLNPVRAKLVSGIRVVGTGQTA